MDGFMFNGPNGGMMFPFFMPQRQNQPPEEKEPPMRVRIAMDYLRLLTHKTSDGAVPHGVGAEVIPGQKLVPAETAAQTAACELLKTYFHGELELDAWEERDQELKDTLGPGKLMSCLLCQSKNGPDPSCTLCRGAGTILVYPTNER